MIIRLGGPAIGDLHGFGKSLRGRSELIKSLKARSHASRKGLMAMLRRVSAKDVRVLGMINADALWDAGYTGRGIVVAGMDTGVDAFHADLASQFRGGTNSWMDVNGQYSAPVDPHSHCTQTIGIILCGPSYFRGHGAAAQCG